MAYVTPRSGVGCAGGGGVCCRHARSVVLGRRPVAPARRGRPAVQRAVVTTEAMILIQMNGMWAAANVRLCVHTGKGSGGHQTNGFAEVQQFR